MGTTDVTSAPRDRTAGGRIPSLDGLRAISIALVLYGHLCGTLHFLPEGAAYRFGDLANLGVRTFFVISGYLITTLLLKERSRTGRVSLRHFYLRRTFRIFPAFYVFLAVVVGLVAAHVIQVSRSSLLMAFTYTINYRLNREWWVGHLWSLAVEEQFYLTWPSLMALLGARRASFAALGLALAAPVIRIGLLTYFPNHTRLFPTGADAIATGCLLACWAKELEASERYQKLLHSRWFYLIPVAAFAVNAAPGYRLNLLAGQTITNVALALVTHRFILLPTGLWGRLLNTRPLIAVGVLSYSLYLWQQFFLDRYEHTWISTFPWNLGFALLAATLSYRLVEKPFLRWRQRIEARMWERERAQRPASASAAPEPGS